MHPSSRSSCIIQKILNQMATDAGISKLREYRDIQNAYQVFFAHYIEPAYGLTFAQDNFVIPSGYFS